jgi:hypothetical protein
MFIRSTRSLDACKAPVARHYTTKYIPQFIISCFNATEEILSCTSMCIGLKKDGHKTVYTKQWASVDSVCPEHSFDKQENARIPQDPDQKYKVEYIWIYLDMLVYSSTIL